MIKDDTKLGGAHNNYLQALMKKKIILFHSKKNEEMLYRKLLEEKYAYLRMQLALKSSHEKLRMLKKKRKTIIKLENEDLYNTNFLNAICDAYNNKEISLVNIVNLNEKSSVFAFSINDLNQISEFNEVFGIMEGEESFRILVEISHITMYCQKIYLYEMMTEIAKFKRKCYKFILKIQKLIQFSK